MAAQCAVPARSFALAVVDIDHFKKINDTYGHAAGDDVLRQVASLLGGQLRTVDHLARVGGEEFAIIMVETSREEAVQTIQRLLVLLGESPCSLPALSEPVTVTLSAGLAMMPDDADSLAALFESADKALYTAKRSGRNRLVTATNRTAVKLLGNGRWNPLHSVQPAESAARSGGSTA